GSRRSARRTSAPSGRDTPVWTNLPRPTRAVRSVPSPPTWGRSAPDPGLAVLSSILVRVVCSARLTGVWSWTDPRVTWGGLWPEKDASPGLRRGRWGDGGPKNDPIVPYAGILRAMSGVDHFETMPGSRRDHPATTSRDQGR